MKCSNCGSPLKKNRKKWYFFGSLVFLLVMGRLVLNDSSKDELENIIELQLSALRDNRITEAYYKYTSQGFQKHISLPHFKDLIHAYASLSNNQGISISDKWVKDTLAVLKGSLKNVNFENNKIAYELIKEDKNWKIASMQLISQNGPSKEMKESVDWLLPIDLQLRFLRQKEFEKAYEGTSSKEFKKATPFEDFKKFVSRYPILQSHTNMVIKSQTLQKGEAQVTVILNPEKEAVPVRYLLALEPTGWKVWNMNVLSAFSPKVEELFQNPDSMRKPVEGQLAAFRSKDYSKAYRLYSSKAFREETTMDDFKKFINSHPILTNYAAIEFKEPLLDQGTGLLEVNLYDQNRAFMTLEYTLGIEDEDWKIWGVQIIKQEGLPETAPVTSPSSQTVALQQGLTITKVIVGNHINEMGVIDTPSLLLEDPLSDVYVNIFIKEGIQGKKVNVYLEHLTTQASVPTVSTTIQKDGDSMISMAFSPPANGFPAGEYMVKVIIDELEKSILFTIK